MYLAERRSFARALFSHHDELRENCFPPLTATFCNARLENVAAHEPAKSGGLRAIQSSEMEVCKKIRTPIVAVALAEAQC